MKKMFPTVKSGLLNWGMYGNFSENSIEMETSSLKNMCLKMLFTQ